MELLQLTGLSKHYGGVHALRGVDFDVRAGEVHALVGENGAGKSTLIKIVSGAEAPDAGAVVVAGEPLTTGSTTAALAAGIATVYQEPPLFGELSVAENVFVGRELRRGGSRFGPVDWAAQRRRVTELLGRLGLDPAIAGVRVADLPVGQRQLVSVAKAVAHRARVLILDEPSAVLTDREIDLLFGLVRTVTADGAGVVYISHRLDELSRIADRVTVLRDGQVVATRSVQDLPVRELAELMVGHALPNNDTPAAAATGEPVLSVRGLGAPPAFDDLTFDLHAGEILALFGLVGSGTDAVARALYGITPARAGELVLNGQRVVIDSPRRAVRAGLAMVPGDRKTQGVFAPKGVAFNVSIGDLRGFWTRRRRERSVTAGFVRSLAIKTVGLDTPVATLSGGNQQKVVLARCLAARPEVLILQEPTQGVDVGAKDEIHALVRQLAAAGSGVLLVSTDLREVQSLADRVIVLRRGRVGTTLGRSAPQAEILAAAAGSGAAA